jgi:hypothetical protein
MRIPGERIKRTRLIQTEKYVVAVEVEMVIPVDDPSMPCYESETVELLRLRWCRSYEDVAAAHELPVVALRLPTPWGRASSRVRLASVLSRQSDPPLIVVSSPFTLPTFGGRRVSLQCNQVESSQCEATSLQP